MSIDVQPFYEKARPYASEDGLKILADIHQSLLQEERDAEAAVTAAEHVVKTLQTTKQEFGFIGRDLRQNIFTLRAGSLDKLITNPDPSRYKPQAIELQQCVAELDYIEAASERLSDTNIPGASINVLQAREALAAAKVAVVESNCDLLIARKLFLLAPLLELEGDIQTKGGLSDAAIQIVFQARADHAQAAEVYRSALQLFEQSQSQQQ